MRHGQGPPGGGRNAAGPSQGPTKLDGAGVGEVTGDKPAEA